MGVSQVAKISNLQNFAGCKISHLLTGTCSPIVRIGQTQDNQETVLPKGLGLRLAKNK